MRSTRRRGLCRLRPNFVPYQPLPPEAPAPWVYKSRKYREQFEPRPKPTLTAWQFIQRHWGDPEGYSRVARYDPDNRRMKAALEHFERLFIPGSKLVVLFGPGHTSIRLDAGKTRRLLSQVDSATWEMALAIAIEDIPGALAEPQ